ncbi:MAG: cysteine dioxygenase family protein [Jatrophihabitans sp.]
MSSPTSPTRSGPGEATADRLTHDQDGVPAHAARPFAQIPSRLGYGDLPDRDLTEGELLELAASLAASPELWRKHVAFDSKNRHYANLFRDAHVDCWVLCWTPVNDTGWHDHDVSSGAVAVAQGVLVEHNLLVGSPDGSDLATEIPAGHVFSFGPDHIHRLTGLDEGSVSVHVYSPPLRTLGQYAVDASGMLRRTVIGYEEELRAPEPVLV